MAEAARVLRPDGTLLLAVPFMWGIHEAPRDFYRFTPYALRRSLCAAPDSPRCRSSRCAATGRLPRCASATRSLAWPAGRLRVPVLAFVSVVQGVGFVLDRLDPVADRRGRLHSHRAQARARPLGDEPGHAGREASNTEPPTRRASQAVAVVALALDERHRRSHPRTLPAPASSTSWLRVVLFAIVFAPVGLDYGITVLRRCAGRWAAHELRSATRS